jgi:hypothetical protein
VGGERRNRGKEGEMETMEGKGRGRENSFLTPALGKEIRDKLCFCLNELELHARDRCLAIPNMI